MLTACVCTEGGCKVNGDVCVCVSIYVQYTPMGGQHTQIHSALRRLRQEGQCSNLSELHRKTLSQTDKWTNKGARKMAQRLRKLAADKEDLGSVSRTQVR